MQWKNLKDKNEDKNRMFQHSNPLKLDVAYSSGYIYLQYGCYCRNTIASRYKTQVLENFNRVWLTCKIKRTKLRNANYINKYDTNSMKAIRERTDVLGFQNFLLPAEKIWKSVLSVHFPME